MDAIQTAHLEIDGHFLSKNPTPSCKCSDRIPRWYIVWSDASGLNGIFMRSDLAKQGIRTRVTNNKLLAYGRCAKLQKILEEWLTAVKQANEID